MTDLSSAELVGFVEEAGSHLGWSTSYLSLIAVAVGAVFQANGVDEAQGVISVEAEAVPQQIDALYGHARARGLGEKTVRTYASTWGRVTRIAQQWATARAVGEERAFWDDIGRFRDSRGRRRSKRPTEPRAIPEARTASSEQASPRAYELPGPPASAVALTPFMVDLHGTPTILYLPSPLSRDDALALIQAILRLAQ
jgi:hypothetical protein